MGGTEKKHQTKQNKTKKQQRRERKERTEEKREKGEREKMGGEEEKWRRRASETIFIIIVDWLGLRATSYLLVFPFYITTNLLLISYY